MPSGIQVFKKYKPDGADYTFLDSLCSHQIGGSLSYLCVHVCKVVIFILLKSYHNLFIALFFVVRYVQFCFCPAYECLDTVGSYIDVNILICFIYIVLHIM